MDLYCFRLSLLYLWMMVVVALNLYQYDKIIVINTQLFIDTDIKLIYQELRFI